MIGQALADLALLLASAFRQRPSLLVQCPFFPCEMGGLLVHLLQEFLHCLMLLLEALGLLVERTLTVPMLEAHANGVVERVDLLFPFQGPGLKRFVASPRIEEIPTHTAPSTIYFESVAIF
jgi:hypothetical protein